MDENVDNRSARDSEHGSVEHLSLEAAASHLLEECRMVLPGIQALFGFQLIAVFNTGFGEKLTSGEQRLHLAAMLCEVVAVALVMAPAAAHRKREQGSVSRDFIELSSRLLLWSMIPLAGAISLDSYLVARIILGRVRPALAVGAGALAAFVVLWMLLPLRLARRSAWD